jgi:hypothetical protein
MAQHPQKISQLAILARPSGRYDTTITPDLTGEEVL